MLIKIVVTVSVVVICSYIFLAGVQTIKRVWKAPDPDLRLTLMSIRDALWRPFSFVDHVQVKATPQLDLRYEDGFIVRPSGPSLITSSDVARFKQYHLFFKNLSPATLRQMRVEAQFPYGVAAVEVLNQKDIAGLRAVPEHVAIGVHFSGPGSGGSVQMPRRPLTPRVIMTMEECLPDAATEILVTLDTQSDRWAKRDEPSVVTGVVSYILGRFTQSIGDNAIEGRVFYTLEQATDGRLVLGSRLDVFPEYVLIQGADF